MRNFGNQILNGADRFIIVSPEYNGSIPGILKLMIDSCDPDLFKGKKVALVGVATGRAGNLRGMDHLTDILHYLQAEVYSLKQPVSQVKGLVNSEKELVDEATLSVLSKQLDGFMNF
jgi:NAD(P)H-dependent FMN reductase